jgi:hypothetical protein
LECGKRVLERKEHETMGGEDDDKKIKILLMFINFYKGFDSSRKSFLDRGF